MKLNMGAGGLLALLGVAAVLIIAALKWLGSNAALITAGIWASGKVLFAGAVLYAAGTLAWRVYRARQAAQAATAEPAAPPPPVRVASEQVPLAGTGEPLALPPGGNHYHIEVSDPETAVAVARALRGDDR